MFNVDSVAALYADGSYRHAAWDKVADLGHHVRLVALAVLHVQNPDHYPNVVVFSGDELYAARMCMDCLMVKTGDAPPQSQEGLWQSIFYIGTGEQEMMGELPKPASAIGGGMEMFNYVIPPDDPNYDALQSAAWDKALALVEEDAPSDGTYLTL